MFLAESTNGGTNWWTIGILAAFFVLMIVMTIIPQRKQKKQQQQMMNSLGVGSKIMTIGGFVGTIVAVDGNNFQVDIGVPGNPQVVVIVKNAVRQSLDAPAQQAAVQEKKAEDKKEDTIYAMPAPTDEQIAELAAKEEATEAVVVEEAVEVKEETPAEDTNAEAAKPVKKTTKKPAAKKATKK